MNISFLIIDGEAVVPMRVFEPLLAVVKAAKDALVSHPHQPYCAPAHAPCTCWQKDIGIALKKLENVV